MHKICSITDCDTKVYAKELCNKHYLQVRNNGSVYVSIRDKKPAIIEGNIAKIPLGVGAKNGYAIVDAKDAHLDKHSWNLHYSGYIHSFIKGKYTSLARLVNNTPKGFETDHINHNKLDNRSSNLRTCTATQNMGNTPMQKNNTTGYKGVVLWGNKYAVKVGYKGKKVHVGYFDTPIEAAKAYDKRALQLFGEYAAINFNKVKG